MAIVAGITTSFIQEALQQTHDLINDTFKIALFERAAALSRATTVYSATGEISGTGYTAGGQVIGGMAISVDVPAVLVTFDKPQWNNATFSAGGALIYNTTQGDKSFVVLDFGDTLSAFGETFRLDLPPVTKGRALIRFP